jgi:hypothetical protein
MRMEAAHSIKASVIIRLITWYRILNEVNLHAHRSENFKSLKRAFIYVFILLTSFRMRCHVIKRIIYIDRFLNTGFIIFITQFRIIISMKCLQLTSYMKMSYVSGGE